MAIGIAVTHGTDDSNYAAFFPSTEEAKANARLIAAAPELLDFAQMVAGGGWDLSDLMEEAREVIAKATQP